MSSPAEFFAGLDRKIKPVYKKTFLATFLLGMLIHLPVMVRDIPNHDGLASMYFDQNMITSARWFLTVACGLSSYYTIPWLIGILGMVFLAFTTVTLMAFFRVEQLYVGVLMGALMVAFPALSSTFCYVFTLDGYMLALFLATLAVYLVEKGSYGFLFGTLCLAFSLGTYQAYLPFAMLLCLFGVYRAFADKKLGNREKALLCGRYVTMGVVGMALYYGLLQVLLHLQGKELSGYQGISSMGVVEKSSFPAMLANMYRDFFAFTLKGNVFTSNIYSKTAMVLLLFLFLAVIVEKAVEQQWYKSLWFYLLGTAGILALPLLSNVSMLISPGVNYHILMRYQYVLYPMMALVVVTGTQKKKENLYAWGGLALTVVIAFTYVVVDEIAYSNLQKKYEKTYAYCNRLLDRIEQTPGYYQGIPVAMIGVVGEESYPVTDVTGKVTGGMIGMSGDSLLYTGANYQAFIAHYLGATLNILPPEAMEEAYYEEFYRNMGSFPAADSIQIVDGILYVKTENKE